jgi:cell division protease FtsH
MVMRWGMSEKLGNLSFGKRDEQVFLGRDIVEEKNYSEATAVEIDKEVRKIIESCYKKAKEELTSNKEKLKLLAERLLEKEVLDFEEVKRLIFPGTASSDKSRQKT